jgi:3-deoxy-D-manno-octulosonate 8-phosphate phosphatase (KDO 8-P phosphatase)
MKQTIPAHIINKAKNIKVFLMDVDGVLTDGKFYIYENGTTGRAFYFHDGMAIYLAHAAGLKTGIISAKESVSIKMRAEELHMDFIVMGAENKVAALDAILAKHKYPKEQIAYIGDDLIDIPLFSHVGLSLAVANAVKETKRAADYTTNARGGDGAIREAVDLILKAQGLFEDLLKRFS